MYLNKSPCLTKATPTPPYPPHHKALCYLLICPDQSQASSDLPALANKTTKLVRQVISFVDRRRRELSLYTHYSGIKHLIVALFTDLIILSAIAETHAHVRHRWWERPFRASVSSAVDPYLLKLHSSLEHLDLALVGAAARGMLDPSCSYFS